MAKYNDISNFSYSVNNMINNTIKENEITNFANNARGLLVDLFTISIGDMCDFNSRNYAYMTYHMIRNIHEKNITLNTLGENAYPYGNADLNSMSPQTPSYTDGNNYYVDFMQRVGINEKNGELTARVSEKENANTSKLFNVTHNYFDFKKPQKLTYSEPLLGVNNESGNISYSGKSGDRNSILYKMEKLYRANKVNTIISDFYTNKVKYNGQVGTDKYGESHGHNLLTEDAEKNGYGYEVNGYENPYCRVWTHHHQYDRLGRTMRSKMGGINKWGNEFEWNDSDVHHQNYKEMMEGKNEIGENYEYAWRGKKNQNRRLKYSVLDYQFGDTGLPIITPKFRGGGESNVHTKSCMFSIENLAWKDYDPYAFEQALSWEQRGPFGGRIMWFPPYNIKITENAIAKWNPSEFIGRGETVYTYVNSERTGSLSFTMITDHPSSLDYSTWWQDRNSETGVDFGSGNSENDYLRYFAGCMGNKRGGDDNGSIGDNGGDDNGGNGENGKDNLQKSPQPMTDEYTNVIAVGVNGDKEYSKEINENIEAIIPPSPYYEPTPEKNEEVVEFYVFFPNNYSGVLDRPKEYKKGKYNINPPKVDAMLYLLAGRNAQKIDGYNDRELNLDNVTEEYLNNDAIGYEMGQNGITTSDYIIKKEYIQGGTYTCPWKKYDSRKWAYRVDHIQELNDGSSDKVHYVCNNGKDGKLNQLVDNVNTLNQGVWGDELKDFASTESFNLKFGDYLKNNLKSDENQQYSFAEVAMAMYSDKVLDNKVMFNYLEGKLRSVDGSIDRVNKLIELFSDENRKLKIECKGFSNQDGSDSRNNNSYGGDKITRRNIALAKNRRDTIVEWIRGVGKWRRIENSLNEDNSIGSDMMINDKNNVKNTGVNTKNGKMYRSAYCKMTFSISETKTSSNLNPNPEKSKSEYFEMIDFWANDKGYKMGDIVQKNIGDGTNKDYRAYSAIDDIIKPDNDDAWVCPDVTDVIYWDELDVMEYKREDHYVPGDYVKYNNFVYETIKEVEGERHFHKSSEEIGFLGFDKLKEKPSDSNPKWEYYKKKATKTSFIDKNDNSDEMQNNVNIDDNDLEEGCDNIWVDRGDGNLVKLCEIKKEGVKSRFNTKTGDGEWNKLRYDQEYYFYRQYFADHPFIFDKLQDKIKYFQPAFHSMTPEGFNARLTFLHQCTRQGNTKTMSDSSSKNSTNNTGGKTANNLAFGRAPYCVLRLGDFYYQMIVIESISFDYSVSDGLVWDMNAEGNGMQPMLCNVNINFKFIGGGDITGPVRRLQNAMSFNYYANTSFYDNRADRAEYTHNVQTMGGAGNDKVDRESSYSFIGKLYDSGKKDDVGVTDNGTKKNI